MIKAKALLSLLLSSVLSIPSTPVLAHAGRVNSEGCHTNSVTGEYHCHPERNLIKPSSTAPVLNKVPSAINLSLSKAQVLSVGDGDTVQVKPEGSDAKVTVRLAFIDAPERSQSYGKEAQARLKELVLNKTVEVRVIAVDKYNRSVGELFLNKKSINLALVAQGQAVVYRAYLKDCLNKEEYLATETKAKEERLGLWAEPNPIMPWEYRRNLIKARSSLS